MPKPRKSLISLEATAYYHCISRCVRRAFLCGEDAYTGRSFEHRRGWIKERLLELARVFAIEVCGYSVMATHSHLVLHVDPPLAESWTTREVVERWHQLFGGTVLSEHFLREEPLLELEQQQLEDLAETWRERLTSVSWFMRCLNEHIARKANDEDDCTGHFWEGRFKSQALLDEQAVLACLAYVDLNPVRAAIATTPEDSDYTSIQRRIRTLQAASQPADPGSDLAGEPAPPPTQPPELYPFVGGVREAMPKGLPFHLADYLELVNWTGRAVREDKRGAIADDLPPILDRLGISSQAWLQLASEFETHFCSWIGQAEHVEEACRLAGHHWARGIGACRRLFQSG
jgi:REP element-mobilizing transposase RayT